MHIIGLQGKQLGKKYIKRSTEIHLLCICANQSIPRSSVPRLNPSRLLVTPWPVLDLTDNRGILEVRSGWYPCCEFPDT